MNVTYRCDEPKEESRFIPPNPRNPIRWWMNIPQSAVPRVGEIINFHDSDHDYIVKKVAWGVNEIGAHVVVHVKVDESSYGVIPLRPIK